MERAVASESPKRETRGTIVRGTVAELVNRQLFDAVRAEVPPEVQALMDNPPKPADWVPSHLWEAMIVQIGNLAGRDAVRDVSLQLTRGSGSTILLPLVRAVFKIFGTSPLAVIKRINTVTYLQFRGVDATYEPETERSGFVVVRYSEPVHEFVYAGWEGAYMYGRDLTGAPNFAVEKFEITEGGQRGRVHVRW